MTTNNTNDAYLQPEEQLHHLIDKIKPVDTASRQACEKHWDEIGKPIHSLGLLEKVWAQIAAIQRNACPTVGERSLIVFCADHGVVAEGVTQTGQEVTAIVAENFFDRKTCTSLMCDALNCRQVIVDIGMVTDTPRTLRKKVGYGTKNMAVEPAMTRAQAIQAIQTGIELAGECVRDGAKLLVTGEMGIGNTTASSAIASVLLQEDAQTLTGRGAGLSNEGLEKKISVIERAIALHQPDKTDPIDVLAKVGGFEIAGMCGVFLGGAIYGVPVLIDGLIAAVAALLAVRIDKQVGDYLLATHASAEPAMTKLLEALHKEAGLKLGMCLGEGSGAIAFLPLLDLTERIYTQMGTFLDINVDAYDVKLAADAGRETKC